MVTVTSASASTTPGAGVLVSLDYDSTAHVPKLLWGWAEGSTRAQSGAFTLGLGAWLGCVILVQSGGTTSGGGR
jgi:hypothetical protein